MKVNNPGLHIASYGKLSDIRRSLKAGNYTSCFIDSINMISDSDPAAFEVLRKDFPEVLFAIIMQSTKDGKFKGSNEYAHNSDINIKVDFGVARTIKNRFGELAEYRVFG
jgi:predicted ATP-dependent serine protease